MFGITEDENQNNEWLTELRDMNFLPEAIERYVEQHTKPESDVLQELNRETHAKIYMPQMLSGAVQGQLLRMISMMVKPKYILEIGTFTGYSAICLSEGLQAGGTLYTIDVNEELEPMVRRYFDKAGVSNKIKFIVGDARNTINALPVTFDLVFIDADKQNYPNYYDMVLDKMNSGGIIIADNVLWSGKVLDEKKDDETKGISAFNEKVQRDSRVDNMMLPLRDGMMLIRKK